MKIILSLPFTLPLYNYNYAIPKTIQSAHACIELDVYVDATILSWKPYQIRTHTHTHQVRSPHVVHGIRRDYQFNNNKHVAYVHHVLVMFV